MTVPATAKAARRYVCHSCGETWPQHPSLLVPCPDCRAPAGAKCRRPSGHGAWGDIHVSREQAAVDGGFLNMCSMGPTATSVPLNPQLSLFAIGGE